MEEIEKAWTWIKNTCSDSTPSLSSNSLGLESFWGLFLIAGISSFSALVIYIAIFINEHRNVLRSLDHNTSTWQKLVVLGRQFNQRDVDSHTFKKAEGRDRSCRCVMDRTGTEASPRGNSFTGPSTFSLQASPHTIPQVHLSCLSSCLHKLIVCRAHPPFHCLRMLTICQVHLPLQTYPHF